MWIQETPCPSHSSQTQGTYQPSRIRYTNRKSNKCFHFVHQSIGYTLKEDWGQSLWSGIQGEKKGKDLFSQELGTPFQFWSKNGEFVVFKYWIRSRILLSSFPVLPPDLPFHKEFQECCYHAQGSYVLKLLDYFDLLCLFLCVFGCEFCWTGQLSLVSEVSVAKSSYTSSLSCFLPPPSLPPALFY